MASGSGMRLMTVSDAQRITLSNAKTFTVRDLNQRTAWVLEEINKHQQPGLITRYGRIVAALVPVAHQEIAEIVLGPATDVGRELETQARAVDEGVMPTRSAEDIAAEFGIRLAD
jgi:antitoxin (DNA-binding transcriptional repressor) of toxin-antitoxin stability system